MTIKNLLPRIFTGAAQTLWCNKAVRKRTLDEGARRDTSSRECNQLSEVCAGLGTPESTHEDVPTLTTSAACDTRVVTTLVLILAAGVAQAQDCATQACNRMMTMQDIVTLPAGVSNPFRDPSNYTAVPTGGVAPREPNNCVSFALDAWGFQGLSGARTESAVNEALTRFRDDRCRQAYELMRHRTDVEVSYAQNLQCRTGDWLAVLMFRPSDYGKGLHMVRQLPDGRFAQILGPGEPIAWVVRNGRIVDSAKDLLPFNTGFDEVCPAFCVGRRSPSARDGDGSMPPTRRQPVAALALTGAWTAVMADPTAQPVRFSKGASCGPYEQKMELLVGVPPGWFGDLIPGSPSGSRVVALEIVSNIIGDATGFHYGGVNLTLAGRLQDAEDGAIAFDHFFDAQGHGGRGEPDRRSGGRIPPLIDPTGGVRLEILELGRNIMRARLDAETVCPRDLVFHRTRFVRGRPENVR